MCISIAENTLERGGCYKPMGSLEVAVENLRFLLRLNLMTVLLFVHNIEIK